MTRALVTGASSGIGLEVTKQLLDNGFLVFANYKTRFKKEPKGNIRKMKGDLLRQKNIEKLAKDVIEQGGIDLLVNCAGIGHFANHEDTSCATMSDLIDLNLKAPLMLSKLLAKTLIEREGMIINIGSSSAGSSARFAATYAATKAGLEHFSKSFFEEMRKKNVRVSNLICDMTLTSFYDNQSFSPKNEAGSFVDPKSVARALLFMTSQPRGTLLSSVEIRPQKINIEKKKRK